MKERLTNNLGLKFIAVFFTIVLWLVVMNVEDPIDTRTFKGISVGIRNDDIITSKGKTYRLSESSLWKSRLRQKNSILSDTEGTSRKDNCICRYAKSGKQGFDSSRGKYQRI